jgi:hypothetical protein
MKKLVLATALVVSFAVGLSLNVVVWDSTRIAAQPGFGSAGIVVTLKEFPACVGLEVAGHPGFFGDTYAGCDN